MQLRREALGTWRHHGRFSANSANLLSYWVVGNNVDIHPCPIRVIGSSLSSDRQVKITTSPELWWADSTCEQFSTCLGSSQFWLSSRHQMLLGSLNDNRIFVLRIRWVDLICYLDSYFDRSSIRIYAHDSQDESIVLSEPPTNWYLPSSGFLRRDKNFLTRILI